MDIFFKPKSIAVVGVSSSHKNLGRIIVNNLKLFNFKGDIYPVGSKTGYVKGLKISSSLRDLKNAPELAIIIVPADRVANVLEDCGAIGIRHCIIESGGFSEFSHERKQFENVISDIAGRYGIRIIGPNCFGAININKGLVLPFFILNPEYMKAGRVSLVSQSGGVFYDVCMYSSCENIGLGKLISIGNKLMINENDCLEYLINDSETEAVGLYLEDFADGRRLMELSASSEKPIVLLKGNISPAGREIAQYHTSALAGDNEVAQAAMAQAGVTVVQNMQEMLECLKIFSIPHMKGNRLAIVSRSGGHSVLSADSAYRYGFELAHFSEEFFSKVMNKKLNVIKATNPLDVGDVYNLDDYSDILQMALSEDGVDGVVFVVTYSAESDAKKVKRFIKNAAKMSKSSNKPVALCVATNMKEWFDIKNAADFPIFSDSDCAIKMLSLSLRRFRKVSVMKRHIIKQIPACKEDTTKTQIFDIFSLLERYGLKVAEYAYVKNVSEAVRAAAAIGYPVALKNASPQVVHKTETKGVILNLSDSSKLVSAMQTMDAQRYLIQKMYPPAAEFFIGVKRDREFGHTMLFGIGGIYVELIRDTTIRILPVNRDMAEEMLEEIKASAILKGFRGQSRLDVESLKDTIVNVSRLIYENPFIENLDINPILVFEDKMGCVVLDAKVKTSK